MLSATFFFSVFTTFVWIFYALSHLENGDLNQFSFTTMAVVLPIFILWAVFGYIYQYISASVFNKNMYVLFKQVKKNQELSDAVARILLEARGSLQDNIILSKFDVFIADMNELLADIIKRSQLLPAEQADSLWIKVRNGGKWAFGKAIIDVAQAQPTLPNKLLQKALADAVLSGTILEFCSRYQSLINALEKHDQARLFLNVIETGVFGKVFSLLALPADSIRQNRDLTLAHQQMNPVAEDEKNEEDSLNLPESFISAYDKQDVEEESKEQNSSPSRLSESARRLFVNTFRKKETSSPEEKQKNSENGDLLSVAFAKSFGESSEEEDNDDVDKQPYFTSEKAETESYMTFGSEVSFETSEDDNKILSFAEKDPMLSQEKDSMPEIQILKDDVSEESSVITPELTAGFQNTQKKLASLKKEWEEAKQRDLRAVQNLSEDEGMPEPKISNDKDFSYPFGGWMNAQNYDK